MLESPKEIRKTVRKEQVEEKVAVDLDDEAAKEIIADEFISRGVRVDAIQDLLSRMGEKHRAEISFDEMQTRLDFVANLLLGSAGMPVGIVWDLAVAAMDGHDRVAVLSMNEAARKIVNMHYEKNWEKTSE